MSCRRWRTTGRRTLTGSAKIGSKSELAKLDAQEKRRKDLADFNAKKRELNSAEKVKILKNGESGEGTYRAPTYFSDAQIRKEVRKDRLNKMGEKAREKKLSKKSKREAGKLKKKLPTRRQAE